MVNLTPEAFEELVGRALDRLPAELGQRHQQIMDAAGFVIARRVMISQGIDDLLVLGANAPGLARLFALGHRNHELLAALNDRIVAI